jgi:hypothetical protein
MHPEVFFFVVAATDYPGEAFEIKRSILSPPVI